MKLKSAICLAAMLLVAAVTAQAQQTENGAFSCSQRKMLNTRLVDRTLRSATSTRHAFDVLKYTINIDLRNNFISPYRKDYSASVLVRFRADSAISQVVLDAVKSSLTIDSVRQNAVSFVQTADKLTLSLDRQYAAGEEAEALIYYRHADVSDGAFYAGSGFVFTDCEPEGARRWLPCYDKPSDKALTDITALVPADVKLGSNGRLQDSLADGNFIKYHWVSRDPVSTYLIVLTARTGYKLDIVNWVNPNTGETVPMRFYYNPGENPSAIKARIGEVTTFFSEKFGDHPFEKNGFATLNSQFAWGGMENQTLTSLCPNCWSESLIVHEFAHQWFGDMITCNTWADIFLNEGFATYLEALWLEHRSGYMSYKYDVEANANGYLSQNPGWAISVPSWAVTTPGVNTLFNYAVTYEKGCSVLHMLRFVMGDDAFFAALKSYASNPEFKYGNATITQFKNAMEASSGQELDWFFDQWIYKPNHPRYQNTYSIAKTGDSKWTVFFNAEQAATPTGTFWQMPLELQVIFKSGKDTTVKVFNSFNRQPFSFDFDSEPELLVFDPDNNIVLKNGTTTVAIADRPKASEGFDLKVSPVPARKEASVSFHLAKPSVVRIVMFDHAGRQISVLADGFTEAGQHRIPVAMAGLASGIYYAVLHCGGHTESTRLVKTE